jgi:hypothetical protein
MPSKRDRNGMRAIRGAELAAGHSHMFVDGATGNPQNLPDFASRFSARNPTQDLALAR